MCNWEFFTEFEVDFNEWGLGVVARFDFVERSLSLIFGPVGLVVGWEYGDQLSD